MNPIELGKFIASLRNEKHITQEELAEKLFIDKKKVSRWECGTSTPEFEMLIKLTKILDVSLYELSICKRVKRDKFSKKIINSFKNIKDYRKYKIKRILQLIVVIALLVFFILTTIYTFKNSGSIKIYELISTNENYNIEGNYFITPKNNSLNIYSINYIENEKMKPIINNINECEYGIYQDGQRILLINNKDDKLKSLKNRNMNYIKSNVDFNIFANDNHDYSFLIECVYSDHQEKHSFNFKLNNIYNNNFFN